MSQQIALAMVIVSPKFVLARLFLPNSTFVIKSDISSSGALLHFNSSELSLISLPSLTSGVGRAKTILVHTCRLVLIRDPFSLQLACGPTNTESKRPVWLILNGNHRLQFHSELSARLSSR